MQTGAQPAIQVLAILPDPQDRESLWEIFLHSNWKLRAVDSFEKAQKHFENPQIGVVITSSELPENRTWKDVLEVARNSAGVPHIIVTSRLADERLWAEVLNLGGFDVILKPFAHEEVRYAVGLAWRFWHQASAPASTAGSLAFSA